MYGMKQIENSDIKIKNLDTNSLTGIKVNDSEGLLSPNDNSMNNVKSNKIKSKKVALAQRTALVRVSQVAAVVLFLGVWQALTTLHIINTFLYGSPSGVWSAFLSLLKDGNLVVDILTTLEETIIGFVIGSLAGSALALILWFVPFAERIIKPFVVAFNGIPKIALAPLLIVWFGAGVTSKIVLAMASTFIVSLITTYQGAYQVDSDLLALFRSYKANRFAMMRWLIAPSAIPWAISALKINVGLALVGAVAGEFISSKRGLGNLVFVAGNLFETDVVLTGLFLLTILAFLLYGLVAFVERVATRHLHT